MLRIFVGGTDEHRLPFEVLKYSIEQRASCEVEVKMIGDLPVVRRVPEAWLRKGPTAFSFQRFLIPEACEFSGRALYLDSDMIVHGDVAELDDLEWPTSNGWEPAVLITPGWQSAVMLLNCSALRAWDITELCQALDRGDFKYPALSNLKFCPPGVVLQSLPSAWNCMDAIHDRNGAPAKLIHYTGMRTQPWLVRGHRYEQQWIDEMTDWLIDGKVEESESIRRMNLARAAVMSHHVRPSLAEVFGIPQPMQDDQFVFPDDVRRARAKK